MPTLTEENYLKAIYHLTKDKDTVLVNELSRMLGVKMPSVNSMMKKFMEKDWVHFQSYKPIVVTPEGKKRAALVVRKHRLTEMFLVEKMGFAWDEVHEIAEEIEHINSEAFFEKIDHLLNFPKADPHGSPIPDKEGRVPHFNYIRLTELKNGEKGIFSALSEAPVELLNHLDTIALSLGALVEVLHVEPFDGSTTLKYAARTHILSKVVCERLLVERIP